MITPDTPHRFEFELTVSATPQQVWDAIASADGISAWMLPTELDPREGGAVKFHMGPDGASEGTVTAFEPTRRIAYAEDWATLVGHPGADVTPLVTEFLVEARSGGTCVVRVVSSAYGTGADWEHEFWGEMETGWAPMLFLVRIERPVPGLVSCFSHGTDTSAVVILSAYLYGPDGAAAAERLRPEWQSLLDELARDEALAHD
jgi:uncharacterized protein YndB with AHSA1/START domain